MHWEVLGATDFFTVEVWTLRGLVRYHVLFVIRLSTRKVHVAGIVPEPDGEWMKQIARNLTDCSDGFLRGCRYLIHDRSTLFTKAFLSILESAGVKSVRLPPRSPNLNAFAERFVRTIKEECLDRMILVGEGSLRRATAQFCEHYHEERNHQGLGNKIIDPDFGSGDEGEVKCRQRLGGLLRYYYGMPHENWTIRVSGHYGVDAELDRVVVFGSLCLVFIHNGCQVGGFHPRLATHVI